MQASVATSSDYYDLLLERQQEQRSSTSLANNTLETPINTSNENKRFRNESDDEEFEEAVETSELADELPEVNSKKKVSKEDFFKYCYKNGITNDNSLLAKRDDVGIWSEWRMHNMYMKWSESVFTIVASMLARQDFFDIFKPLEDQEYATKRLMRGERIEWLLMEHHKLSVKQFRGFLVNLIATIQKRTGKKNCMAIIGSSNSGKSMLFDTFTKAYFNNCYGQPVHNPRSGFPFGDCLNQRVILYEEPMITMDNIEDMKKILGGQDHKIDVKYKSQVHIERTPVLITANHRLEAKLGDSVGNTLTNRCFTIYLSKPIPEGCEHIPITKDDWDILLSKYWYTFGLCDITYTTGVGQKHLNTAAAGDVKSKCNWDVSMPLPKNYLKPL